jgi:molecular chaperone HscB
MPPAAESNYFQLFGLPADFDLDAADLSARYRELARALHPDRHARGPDHERRLAAQRMATLNEAYRTLKEPLRRAQYLLTFDGTSSQAPAADTAFLVQQMEWRERLEESRSARDALAALKADVLAALAEREQRLRHELAREQRDARAAHITVQEMQYLDKLLWQIQESEETFV